MSLDHRKDCRGARLGSHRCVCDFADRMKLAIRSEPYPKAYNEKSVEFFERHWAESKVRDAEHEKAWLEICKDYAAAEVPMIAIELVEAGLAEVPRGCVLNELGFYVPGISVGEPKPRRRSRA